MPGDRGGHLCPGKGGLLGTARACRPRIGELGDLWELLESIIVMGMGVGTGFLGIAGRGKGQGAQGESYGSVVIMKVRGWVYCK